MNFLRIILVNSRIWENGAIKDLLIFEENKNEENNESYNTDNNKDVLKVLLKEKKKIVK